MDTAYIWIAGGSLAVAVITVVLSGWQNNMARRDKRDEQQQELGKTSEILRGINDMLEKLDEKTTKSNERLECLDRRLVKVEESTKSAHHRIDEHIEIHRKGDK